jgi:hypothetical protein
MFTATLSQAGFLLYDGTLFIPSSTAFAATLLPAFGSELEPDAALALLAVSNAPVSSVPEPDSVVLLVIGLVPLITLKTKSQ